VAKLRLDCKRRGIMRLHVGPDAVAANFLHGTLRKSRAKSRERDGEVYIGNRNAEVFERILDNLELLLARAVRTSR
jgi:transcription-repair coupling factor (superfamily II helicase)